jgi:hypothetical protein
VSDDPRKLLEAAANEIRMLRSVVRDLEVKADAFAAILQILGMTPQTGQGMSLDLAWTIDRYLIDTKEEAAPKAPEELPPHLRDYL